MKYTSRQRVLLSLVARRTDLLTADLLKEAAVQIAETMDQYNELNAFLQQFVVPTKDLAPLSSFAYYSTTIVMDELVDYIFWEMVVPSQEICRMSSMAILFKLYDTYAAQIQGGYLRIKAKKGLVLCNPGAFYPHSMKDSLLMPYLLDRKQFGLVAEAVGTVLRYVLPPF